MERENFSKKNIRVAIAGLFLILSVFVVTLGRSGLFSQKKSEESLSKDNSFDSDELEKRKITAESLSKKNTSNDNMIGIIDVRDRNSYEAEHIADSINIPQEDLFGSLAALDKSKVYAIVDQSGSSVAANLALDIEKKGFLTDVYYLSGGFSQWKAEYNPTVSFGDPTSLVDQSKVSYVDSEELSKMISGGESKKFFLVDLREGAEFGKGHIKDSINISIDELEKRRRELPIGKKIILVDANGVGAFLGAVRLFDLGIMNVFSLSDGLLGWESKKYDLVK